MHYRKQAYLEIVVQLGICHARRALGRVLLTCGAPVGVYGPCSG